MKDWIRDYIGDGKRITGIGLAVVALSLAIAFRMDDKIVSEMTRDLFYAGMNLAAAGFGIAVGRKIP